MTDYDVLVIGAGQSGLAAGHALSSSTDLTFLLLEAGDQPGGSWPQYYDSLTLFSPARFCALPGLPFPGEPDRYPSRDEVTDYLRQYADHRRLPVLTLARVAAVQVSDVGFTVELIDGRRLTARAVIAAAGVFGAPVVPALPGLDGFAGELLHVAAYRRPDRYAGQRIVVVGGGNSAVQVAVELAEVADVTLATRRPLRLRRQRPLGVDLHHWLRWGRIDSLPLGARAAGSVGVLDDGSYGAALAADRPDRRPMFRGFTTDGVRWTDGSTERVDTVLLATGYRPALDFLPGQAFASSGVPAQRRGISTTVPGLAFLGLPGQYGLASAMLRGVGPDAARVVRHLRRHLGRAATASTEGEVPA